MKNSENYENFINKSKSTKTNVFKKNEITKMILKIMKTNLEIVKQIKTEYFSNANVKKLEYVERFKTTLSTLKSPKKCQNCETKTKTATAHTQISRTLEDFKKH